MSTSVDTMKNLFNVLKLYAYDTTTDGVAILDHAISTVSHFASLQDAVNSFVFDMTTNLAETGNPWQTLYDKCGIVLGANNDLTVDTGAVSGYNAGMGVIKDAQTIVPEPNVNLSELAMPAEGSTTTHSYTGADGQTFTYTITYPQSLLEVYDIETSRRDENGIRNSYYAQTTTLQAGEIYRSLSNAGVESDLHYGEELVPTIITVDTGIENYWADSALKVIYDSFGLDFNGKILRIQFGINQESLAETGPPLTDPGNESMTPATTIDVKVNTTAFTPMDPNNVNGYTYVTGDTIICYFDRTFVHELVHGVMYAAGITKNNMPEFFTEGVAELVHGVDDYNGMRTQSIIQLASDPNYLAQSLQFKEGTLTSEAYPAGFMFLRYLCHESLNTQVAIGNGTTPELFTYTGNEEIISGEANGSQINLASGIEVTETAADENNMAIGTTAGNLIIRNARGKLLNFGNETGIVTGRSYLATEAGIIDGRNYGEYEFICGANGANNEIYAGDGGSRLWGGSFGMDMLVGGNGADEFIVGVGCGSDIVNGVDSNDVINLATTTLDQITGINATSSGVEMSFEDGSEVSVIGNDGASYNFKLGDGSAYTYSSGEWTKTA